MAASKDWLPTTREGILAMAKDWEAVMTASADAWGIPPAVITELHARIQTAEAALCHGEKRDHPDPRGNGPVQGSF
ncbi:MAG: hypothetical protein LBP71_06735 [Spirochaetaceae bacterium]|jgi:hypothetical protein|nr:hypothetical protein [Spirochaetaceae bacterium]